MQHYGAPPHEPMPEKPLVFGVMHYRHSFQGKPLPQPVEEYFIALRLPVYGMRYSIEHDDFRWSQDCLYIGLNRGFRIFWRALPVIASGL